AQSGTLRGTATWPAGITTVCSREGKTLTTDGPYAETREGVGGFFLVDVQDLDAAIKVAERVPGGRYGAVEVRPVQAEPFPSRSIVRAMLGPDDPWKTAQVRSSACSCGSAAGSWPHSSGCSAATSIAPRTLWRRRSRRRYASGRTRGSRKIRARG